MTSAAVRERQARDAVDPEILRIVGDVARPRSAVPYCRELGHLPGRSGLVAGVETLVRMLLEGEAYFSGLARRHGPVFRHMLGPTPAVFVADPELIWTLARNEDGLFSPTPPWTDFFLGLLPGDTVDGLLTLDFERHRDARRLLQPAFSAQAIAGYLEGAREIYDRTLDGWLRQGRIRFKPEVRRLFASVSARVFMGVTDPAEAALLDGAMIDGWQAVLAVRKRSVLSPGWWRARRGMARLWETFRPRQSPARQGPDLFSRMCQTRDEADWLDDDTRLRLFIMVMFAAFDTTSSGTASMGHLLGRHPDWQERLRQEVLTASPSAEADELKGLEQLEWVWKETLRLYPVAGQLTRMALSETILGGHRIPARTFLFGLSGSAARDPRWWSQPTRFDPERFSAARAEDRQHRGTFLPFGAGAHTCIGAHLAGIEVKAFWQALLRRCRLRLVHDRPEGHSYTPIGMVRGDVEVTVERA